MNSDCGTVDDTHPRPHDFNRLDRPKQLVLFTVHGLRGHWIGDFGGILVWFAGRR
jgi:hypothetical protein